GVVDVDHRRVVVLLPPDVSRHVLGDVERLADPAVVRHEAARREANDGLADGALQAADEDPAAARREAAGGHADAALEILELVRLEVLLDTADVPLPVRRLLRAAAGAEV